MYCNWLFYAWIVWKKCSGPIANNTLDQLLQIDTLTFINLPNLPYWKISPHFGPEFSISFKNGAIFIILLSLLKQHNANMASRPLVSAWGPLNHVRYTAYICTVTGCWHFVSFGSLRLHLCFSPTRDKARLLKAQPEHFLHSDSLLPFSLKTKWKLFSTRNAYIVMSAE